MSVEDMFSKFKAFLPDMKLKRKRNSNSSESGPPAKLIKNVPEHRFFNDDFLHAQRSRPVKRSFLERMGLKFTKSTFNANACEPTDLAEYSDEEDLYIVQKFKKKDINASYQIHQTNHPDRMNAFNNKSGATRPPPGLIPKNKFSRVPDLQKLVTAPSTMRMNGFQSQNENRGNRNYVLNGSSLSFKSQNCIDNTLNLGRKFSNYINLEGSAAPKLSTLTPRQQTDDFKKYETLLKSIIPDYQLNSQDHVLPTSNCASIFQNHITNNKPTSRKLVHSLSDDDFKRKTEDTTMQFRSSFLLNELRELKVTPINTVRLRIESTPALKPSFPENVKEKRSASFKDLKEKIAQQQKEADHLTTIRQKHSELYDRHVPGWISPEPFIFSEDIEEKVDDFPEFTDHQKQTIRQAMNGNPHTLLISKFNFQISRDHIQTLQWEPLAWLNDEVINFYMSLLTERGSQEGYPKVYAMNTFFTQRLSAGGFSAVKRWTKKVDLFACDIIPVPVHVGNVHWCMAIIDMREKTIKYYDSMGSPNNRVLSSLEDYLREESLDKRKIAFDLSGWSKENVTDNPRQTNGSDCGVFSCMTAEFICRNRPIVFNQQHMNYFRQRMVLEICTGKLLL